MVLEGCEDGVEGGGGGKMGKDCGEDQGLGMGNEEWMGVFVVVVVTV